MERMLVVGAGTMGAQIATVCALAGHDTTVTDLTDDVLARAESSLRSRLDRDVAKGRHAVTGDPRDLPSRTVTELVERGDLGRKTGKGF